MEQERAKGGYLEALSCINEDMQAMADELIKRSKELADLRAAVDKWKTAAYETLSQDTYDEIFTNIK